MGIPFFTIVGRANVGKSALFNAILQKNQALVTATPGATRDYNIELVQNDQQNFYICDTGGLSFHKSDEPLQPMINQQVEFALSQADAILFVVDRKDGLTAADREVCDMLRPKIEKVVLVVNKVDDPKHEVDQFEFYQLGIKHFVSVSAMHRSGINHLIETLLATQPVITNAPSVKEPTQTASFNPSQPTSLEQNTQPIKEAPLKIALIGRPNSGKSTLANQWIGFERQVTSDIPGTTRDAIDSEIQFHKQKILLIDTAGLKRKSKWETKIENFTGLTSLRAIERADVCVLVFDVQQGFVDQDQKIAQYALEQGKSLILAGNKWDLYPEKNSVSVEKFRTEFYGKFSYLEFCPIVLFSALTKQRVYQLLEKTVQVAQERTKRVQSAELNQVLTYIRNKLSANVGNNQKINVKYGTQIKTNPPLFLFYTNHADLVPKNFERFMVEQIRRFFGFSATPIKIFWRSK